jgi:hypothetical protein
VAHRVRDEVHGSEAAGRRGAGAASS